MKAKVPGVHKSPYGLAIQRGSKQLKQACMIRCDRRHAMETEEHQRRIEQMPAAHCVYYV